MIRDDLVSIITPAYNCEKFIVDTIESVIAQSYLNWEMIIINDKSSDNTKSIVEKYCSIDSRIKLINQEKNSGVAKARNVGIEAAEGRFIAFLDSDDCWKNDKLKKQLEFMKKNDYALTYTSYEYISEDGKKLNKIINIPSSQNYKQGLKNTIIGCLTVIVDREKVGDFEMPQLSHGEDHATWLKIMKSGHVAYGLNENLALYRVSKKSLTGNKFKVVKLQWKNYRENEGLSSILSFYYFIAYLINAFKKHYF
jgi:teichuronic acid biosynthesis glycosyltransferase TuaG